MTRRLYQTRRLSCSLFVDYSCFRDLICSLQLESSRFSILSLSSDCISSLMPRQRTKRQLSLTKGGHSRKCCVRRKTPRSFPSFRPFCLESHLRLRVLLNRVMLCLTDSSYCSYESLCFSQVENTRFTHTDNPNSSLHPKLER